MKSGVLLYIDPGTGSMLFTILLSMISILFFLLQKLKMKAKMVFLGKKAGQVTEEHAQYVIFSDDKRYWSTFRAICDEFEKRKIPVLFWTASPDDPALQEKYEYVTCEFIGEGNRAYARLNIMHADICLSTTPGLDVYQWKRSKNVKYYVHILHAVTSAATYRMFGLDAYDAVLLSGDFQKNEIRTLEKERKIHAKELEVVGSVYMDEKKKMFDSRKKAEEHEGIVVLLAPSWGPASILCRYGEKIIQSLVDTGYELIIRPHPQSKTADKKVLDTLKEKYPDRPGLCWDFESDNFESLNRSDIMITDFSGVIFDYTFVFGKPTIYAENSFDDAIYDAAWLEKPMWKDSVLPTLGIPLREENFGQLKQIIRDTVESREIASGMEKARSEAWMHIGESAKRAVDFLIRKESELTDLEEEIADVQTAS